MGLRGWRGVREEGVGRWHRLRFLGREQLELLHHLGQRPFVHQLHRAEYHGGCGVGAEPPEPAVQLAGVQRVRLRLLHKPLQQLAEESSHVAVGEDGGWRVGRRRGHRVPRVHAQELQLALPPEPVELVATVVVMISRQSTMDSEWYTWTVPISVAAQDEPQPQPVRCRPDGSRCPLILSLQPQDEWDAGHVSCAHRALDGTAGVDDPALGVKALELAGGDTTTPIVTYCYSGNELVFGVNLHVVLLANNVFGRASAAVGPLHSLGRT